MHTASAWRPEPGREGARGLRRKGWAPVGPPSPRLQPAHWGVGAVPVARSYGRAGPAPKAGCGGWALRAAGQLTYPQNWRRDPAANRKNRVPICEGFDTTDRKW